MPVAKGNRKESKVEFDNMAKIYADLIKKGLKTLDEVPIKLREEVKKLLNNTADM